MGCGFSQEAGTVYNTAGRRPPAKMQMVRRKNGEEYAERHPSSRPAGGRHVKIVIIEPRKPRHEGRGQGQGGRGGRGGRRQPPRGGGPRGPRSGLPYPTHEQGSPFVGRMPHVEDEDEDEDEE